MDSLFRITCGECRQSAPVMEWVERPSGLKLPEDCFQCPSCSVAIKRVRVKVQPELVADAVRPWWYGRSYIKLEKIPAYL